MSTSGKSYKVSLAEKKYPSCECPDWKRTKFPCKHMFAIFRLHPDWNFDQLPEPFKNSVYLNLDEDLVFITNIKKEESDDGNDDNLTEHNQDSSNVPSEIPIRKRYHINQAARCRDFVKQINSLTYLAKEESLQDLETVLLKSLNELKGSSSYDVGGNLILNPTKKVKKSASCSKIKKTSN